MQNISFILYLLAAICCYVGAHHFVYFARRRKEKVNLIFSAMCLVHTSYFIAQGRWYSSTTVEQSLACVQFAYAAISMIMVIQLWFFHRYCKKPFRIAWCYLGTAVFTLYSIVSLIPSDSTLSIGGAFIKEVRFFHLVDMTVYEFRPGSVMSFFFIFTAIEMIFLLVVVGRYYLKRYGTVWKPMPVAWFIAVIVGFLDTLSALEVIDLIYMSEFAYMLIVLSMAHRLNNDFIDAMNEVERLNISLDAMVLERTRELESVNRELKVLSNTDQLTGLYNRRFAEITLREHINRSKRYGSSLSVMILDIDHFKNVNDTYGHDVGDQVLVAVAKTIAQCIRNTDTVARWGGEEFIVLAPETDMEVCTRLAERLRDKLALCDHPCKTPVTASFGVASFQKDDTPSSIVQRADTGLYAAKDQGRNCVVSP